MKIYELYINTLFGSLLLAEFSDRKSAEMFEKILLIHSHYSTVIVKRDDKNEDKI